MFERKNPRPVVIPEEIESLRNTTLATIAELSPPGTPAIVSTETLAKISGIKPGTIRCAISRSGHWLGLTPLRLGTTFYWKLRG